MAINWFTKYGLIQLNLTQTTRIIFKPLVSLITTMRRNLMLTNQISKHTMVKLVKMLQQCSISRLKTVWLQPTLKMASLSHLVIKIIPKLSIQLSLPLVVTISLTFRQLLKTVRMKKVSLTYLLVQILKTQRDKQFTTTTQQLRRSWKHLKNQLKNVLLTFQLVLRLNSLKN